MPGFGGFQLCPSAAPVTTQEALLGGLGAPADWRNVRIKAGSEVVCTLGES